MTNLPDLLKRLEDAARRAAKTEWVATPDDVVRHVGNLEMKVAYCYVGSRDAQHIALNNPQTTLTLIEIIRTLRGALEYYGKRDHLRLDRSEMSKLGVFNFELYGYIGTPFLKAAEHGYIAKQALTRADKLAKEIK